MAHTSSSLPADISMEKEPVNNVANAVAFSSPVPGDEQPGVAEFFDGVCGLYGC